MKLRSYRDWEVNEAGVPGTPFGLQVGDYFMVTGNAILAGKVLCREDKTGNRWRIINNSPEGSRSFSSGSLKRNSLKTSLLKEIGEQSAYYVKATRVHPTYMEGIIKYGNGLMTVPYQLRVESQYVSLPDEKNLDIFISHAKSLTDIVGQRRFVVGDEELYNESGIKKIDIIPGVYSYYTYDFKLTDKIGQPMLYCSPSIESINDEYGKKNLMIPLSVFLKMKLAPSEGESAVISNWFSKRIGGEVKCEEKSSKFEIPWFRIEANPAPPLKSNFTAQPFLSRSLAQRHIDKLLAEEEEGNYMPFDSSTLRIVEGGSYSFTFIQLMDYAKILGLDIENLRELFHNKRGEILGKKFDL